MRNHPAPGDGCQPSTTERGAAPGELANDTLLGQVYRTHYGSLLRVCTTILRNEDDAEDAVQEAFLRAAGPMASRARVPSAYLFAVARNVCHDIIRSRRRREASELTADVVAPGPGPETMVAERSALCNAWGRLSARDRVLLANRFAGYEYSEIADRFGLSAKSVSVGLVRARSRVRKAMDGLVGAVLAGVVGKTFSLLRRQCSERRSALEAAIQVATSRPAGEVVSVVVAACLLGSSGSGATPAPVAAPPTVASPGGDTGSRADVGRSVFAPPTRLVAAAPASSPAPPARRRAGTASPPAVPTVSSPSSVSDTRIDSVTPSPSYQNDHTLFAEGLTHAGIPALYESTDGGTTWQRRPAAGFAGGQIVLPATWPQDRRMFAGTEAGLEESRDGGNTWTVAVPLPGPIATAEDSETSGYRVVIAAATAIWTYDANTGSLQLGPSLPAGTFAQSMTFAGDLEHVVLGAVSPLSTGLLLRCDLVASCQTDLAIPHGGAMSIAAPVDAAPTFLAATDASGDLYTSTDAGRSFERVPMGQRSAGAVAAINAGSANPQLAVTFTMAAGTLSAARVMIVEPTTGQLRDLPSAIPSLFVDMAAVLILPDGRTLAVQRQSSGGPTSWWTSDGGSTWQMGVCAGLCLA